MNREVSPNSRIVEAVNHPISRGILFFLLCVLSLAVSDAQLTIRDYTFAIPVEVFHTYAGIAFSLSVAYFIAAIRQQVASFLANLFETPPTSKFQSLCASFYFVFYLTAFLLVFISGLMEGIARIPYDSLRFPLLLIGIIWLGLMGFIFARYIYQSKRKPSGSKLPPSSQEASCEHSEPLISDSPLDDPCLDRFKRFPFAQRIARTIASKKAPSSLAIGIYGEWGAGKTTVLNFVARELENHPKVICIRFNPWYFEDETHMLLNFFQTLSDVLGRKISTQAEEIGKWLRVYGSIVAPVSLSLGGFVQLSPGEITKKIGESLSSLSMYELRERIEKTLRSEKKRVVIIVDDIDRLDKDEIHTIFKLVKLLADFPYTAYVLAFDDVVVKSALEERYCSASSQSGGSFLEKIVQVPLKLPLVDKISLRKLCFECIDKALNEAKIRLTEDQRRAFAYNFIDGLEIRVQTPRIAKRYGNALSFSLPILEGEVNTIDLMLIEGLRVFYPTVYDIVRSNPDVFLGSNLISSSYEESVKKHGLDIINECTRGLTNDEANSLKNLIKVLFPRVQTILSNVTYGGEWDKTWADGQNIASSKYFDRYFSYSVPEGDISDQEIASLLQRLDTQSPTEIGAHLREIATERNVEVLLYKLRIKEKKLGAPKSRNLALALSSIGDIFPNPDIPFAFTNPFHQAAILIAQLVKNLPEGTERLSLGEAIVKEGEPISFAAECLRWIETPKEKEGDKRIFSKKEEQILEQIIVSRIRDISGDKLLYRDFPKDAPSLLFIWSRYGSKDETDDYLTNSFKLNRENVLEFLKCYIPTSWGLESGLPRRGDFEREQYDAVAKVVNPDNILEALKELGGSELASFGYQELNGSLDIDKAITYQFVRIHNLGKNEGEKADRTETPGQQA